MYVFSDAHVLHLSALCYTVYEALACILERKIDSSHPIIRLFD